MESHLKDQIIGDISQKVTYNYLRNVCDHLEFLSQIEPKNIDKALNDKS